MISYPEAVALIRAQVRPLPGERCLAAQAAGRVLAADIISPEHLPPFDNSAMDGAAFHTGGMTLPAGSEFGVMGVQVAGDAAVSLPFERSTSDCWQIMTGARMPDGTDSVMPIEQLEILARDDQGHPARFRLTKDLAPLQNVRCHGEDVASGDHVLAAGHRLDAAALAMLSALGIAEVEVCARPRVALVCTGSELVDDPRAELASGQIRNINAPFLTQRLQAAGTTLVANETLTDDPALFDAFLQRMDAQHCDVILSCGAVSMGDFDFVPAALQRAGAEIFFHKVQMRPGKPILFARLPNGCWYFGLPGNPVSSAVGLRFFVEPALRRLQNLPDEQPLRLPLANDCPRKAPWQLFLKGRVELGDNGQLTVRVLPGQESFRIRPLLQANCWISVPGIEGVARMGKPVDVYLPGHSDGLQL